MKKLPMSSKKLLGTNAIAILRSTTAVATRNVWNQRRPESFLRKMDHGEQTNAFRDGQGICRMEGTNMRTRFQGIDLQRDTAYARPAARFAATVTITVTTTATTTTTMKKVVAVPVITEKKVVAIIITITTMNRIVAVTIITTVKGIMAVTIAMQASPVDMGPLTVVNPLAIMEVTTVVNPLAIMEVPTEMIDVMSVPAVSTDTIIADNAHIAETVDFAEEKPCVIVDTSEAQDVD